MADPNASPAPTTNGTLPTADQQAAPTHQEQTSQHAISDQPAQQVTAPTTDSVQAQPPAQDPAQSQPQSAQQSQQPQTQPQSQPPTQPAQPTDAELDTSIVHEMADQPPATQPSPAAAAASAPSPIVPPPQNGPTALHPDQPTQEAVLEPRIPHKKDASLRDFLSKMDDYTPLIPDAVTDYYLTLAGLPPPPQTDRRLARLLALATQKFIADIAADAYQYSRIRSTNTTSNNPLTGLGGAAGFGMGGAGGDGGEGGPSKGKKDAGKNAPLGGPRAGYGGGGAGGGQGRTVLTMEDLGMAVGEYGVNVKRGEFYR
jgi:transcription initiation factor TFIID subunit 10